MESALPRRSKSRCNRVFFANITAINECERGSLSPFFLLHRLIVVGVCVQLLLSVVCGAVWLNEKKLFLSDFFYENTLKIGKFNLILRVQIIDYKWVIPHFSQLRGGG